MIKIYITLFKAEWCGSCKAFQLTWEKFKKVMEQADSLLKKHDIIVFLNEYEDTIHNDIINRNKIKYYPTIRISKIINDNKTTFDLQTNDRNIERMIDIIFKDQSTNLINDIKKQINQLNGGFMTYSNNKRLKYYREYIKCKKLYFDAKYIKKNEI
jgi:thiol-disulfide isomerase/thioredoxin